MPDKEEEYELYQIPVSKELFDHVQSGFKNLGGEITRLCTEVRDCNEAMSIVHAGLELASTKDAGTMRGILVALVKTLNDCETKPDGENK